MRGWNTVLDGGHVAWNDGTLGWWPGARSSGKSASFFFLTNATHYVVLLLFFLNGKYHRMCSSTLHTACVPAGSICTLLSGGWQWEQMPPLLLLPRLDNLDVPHSFESAGFMGYKKKKGLVKEIMSMWSSNTSSRAPFWGVQCGERAEVLREVTAESCLDP